MGGTPQFSPPLKKGILRLSPHPLSIPQGRGIPLLRGLFPAVASCSARRVGLTPQTLEVALLPLARLVSASCHLSHKGLDGGRNDAVSLLPFGAIRCSTTLGFSSGHLLAMPSSISLVADPSRRHELACQRTSDTANHGNHQQHLLYPTSYFHNKWRMGQANYSTMKRVVNSSRIGT